MPLFLKDLSFVILNRPSKVCISDSMETSNGLMYLLFTSNSPFSPLFLCLHKIFEKDLDHLEEQVSSDSYGFSNYNVICRMRHFKYLGC